ncbi:apicoplast import protein Tic20, putative [Plasmodium relictum]|uniref:Apicoplast import protein Tic20, putative n=1 Tax=Plasmodium relictum TaxID=85471 RepID=A0A1J1H5W2_PLARL|nr:apicoplast import protein Tic20, putative [Plasmodium relictum]CRH00318.1 apicoplast import protein Tic20, putative [Plasmodium relictum]
MFNFLLIYILIYFGFNKNALCFQISQKIKTYSLKKINIQNSINYKYGNNKRNLKVYYYLMKNKSTNKCIKKKEIYMSLKKKISLIFHGESDITILDKCIASISYILPFMDAVQAFVMPLVNILPVSLHKYLFQIEKINQIYSSIPFLSFATFMGLYFLFVKENKFKFHYFIKYHHMQSLILSMFGYALALFYFRVFPYSYNDTDISNLTVLYSTMTIYFGSLIVPFFASLLGYYIEIPVLSEAIKLHIGEKKVEGEDL